MNKIAVINFSGNVGKSSIAHYLLAPRLDCSVVAIESINSTGRTDITLRGKESEELQTELLMSDDIVVDVGASNVEDFIDSIKQFQGGIDEFDAFVVPTVPVKKQQQDTIGTIEQLNDLRVAKNKIKVVLNQFDAKSGSLESQYSSIYSVHSKLDNFELSSDSYLPKHMFFEAFQRDGRSFDEVMEDDNDYRQMIADTDDRNQKVIYARKIGLKKLAMGINKDLDRVFSVLFDA